MIWHPVESSNIKELAYDHEGKTMGVRFTNGTEYHYGDVPHETFGALKSAQSVGRHFHVSIRGQFSHTKAET